MGNLRDEKRPTRNSKPPTVAWDRVRAISPSQLISIRLF